MSKCNNSFELYGRTMYTCTANSCTQCAVHTYIDTTLYCKILIEHYSNYVADTAKRCYNSLEVKGDISCAAITGTINATTISTSGNSTLHKLSVVTDTSLNTVHVNGNVTANGANITPVQLGYVAGATFNLQSQIDAKAHSANPTFTGTVTIPTTQNTDSRTLRTMQV